MPASGIIEQDLLLPVNLGRQGSKRGLDVEHYLEHSQSDVAMSYSVSANLVKRDVPVELWAYSFAK